MSSSNAITISEPVLVNATIWVRSLPEAEHGPSRRIVEDVEPLTAREGQVFELIDVGDRAAFFAALQGIAAWSRAGLRPILHLDAHGHADRGIRLAPSGEAVSWEEVAEALREINIATGNNLVCVLGLCFGLHLYKILTLRKAVPAYLFMAPESEIQVGDLEERVFSFYRSVHASGNVTAAFDTHLAGAMTLFHCQGLFLEVLAAYVRSHCRGSARTDRFDRLATALVKRRGQIGNRQQLRSARSKASTGVRPGPHLIRRFAPTFLIGRTAAFTYNAVERLALRR